jgi:hypothetical protein
MAKGKMVFPGALRIVGWSSPEHFEKIVQSRQSIDFPPGYGQRPNPHRPSTSTIEARQFRFCECVDTEDMFVESLSGLQEQRGLPQ